jgi:dTMP kinase
VLIDANSDPDTVAGRIWTVLRDRLLPTPASVVSI